MIVRTSLFILLASLCACQWQDLSESNSKDKTLIKITQDKNKSYNISQQDLPITDQIKLHNLSAQLHDSTLSSLRQLVEQQHSRMDKLDWNLPIPLAPNFNIPVLPSWTQGQQTLNPDTLQLDILCSYASRPCAQVFSTLQEFLPLLSGDYQIRFYDFPQSYHHLGLDAAMAVECLQGDAKLNLQNYLWIQQGQLNITGLKGAIKLYSSNPMDTFKCMDKNDTRYRINQKISLLEQAGFQKTPTVLLNGQYLTKGKESHLIVKEMLPLLDLNTASQSSGFKWVDSWVNKKDQYTWGLVEHQGEMIRVTPGVQVDNAWIAQVTATNIAIIKQGKLHWLNSPQKTAELPLHAPAITSDLLLMHEQDTYEEQSSAMNDQERYEQIIKNIKAQSLPPLWLEQQLMRQTELEESLFLTKNTLEGKSLVKLNAENIDEFYTSLGMMPGDVIMRVNDQWVHEENNPLFQTLANEEDVTISVMRKGLPIHFAFKTTD